MKDLHKQHFTIPVAAINLLENCKGQVQLFENYEALAEASLGGDGNQEFEVQYEVPGKGIVTEAVVHKVSNGISVNYTEPYMRRRDPDTMVIADDKPTDKERYKDRYGKSFDELRQETLEWLKGQDLAVFFFKIGMLDKSPYGMAIAPANAGFFCDGFGYAAKDRQVGRDSEGYKNLLCCICGAPFQAHPLQRQADRGAQPD
jgi:hypothetical protein